MVGAGGRAGRAVVKQAAARGVAVTAAVRDPSAYGPVPDDVVLVRADVTDADSLAAAAAGHDTMVVTAARLDVDASEFFRAAATAVVDATTRAGVTRVVLTGIGTLWVSGHSSRLLDDPALPDEARTFSLGHLEQLRVVETADVDWLIVAPPPVFLEEDGDPHPWMVATSPEDAGPFSFADLGAALLDEALSPKHHREVLQVTRS
ncbi:hypothetical protein VV02_13640 [Luteipulveratus mongoliensis]|uniref:NAD(P)-binding domain-containing protein n=1 Tax=Luteipulveratus mongoliensis TaxID=571913 RepID=A0A0K1JQP8_9MICO|nr:hypothetical protein VV02_13640 [Luteipulveratus mongoliensis]